MEASRLNIVGCGRLGRVIARLFLDATLVRDLHVCNRSLESGQRAVREILRGVAHSTVDTMPLSDLWLIGCGDEDIPRAVEALMSGARLSPTSIVFHCSGVMPSTELAPLRERGCSIASIHPARSFANTEMATRDFPGTLCGSEGDARAIEVLGDLFRRVGGEVFKIPTEAKLVCHAGHVFASNYLVALLQTARDLYVAAGIPQDLAWRLMEPLVRGTVENVMRLGPAKALTGPIARGESAIVARQLGELRKLSEPLAELYSQLGLRALDVAREQGLPESRGRLVEESLK